MRTAAARDLFGNRIRKAPPAIERRTHIAIADLLRHDCRREVWWTHIPSGELRSEATGALLKRMGLKPGMSDFLLIPVDQEPRGLPHWLELKRGNLGQITEDQEAFAELCRLAGMPYELVRSFDAAKAQLDRWGFLRGRLKVI